MSFAAPLVARHFQIRYSTSAGRAGVGNFQVEGGPNDVFFAKIKEGSAARLELHWVIPDLPLPIFPNGSRGPVSYAAIFSLASGQIFITEELGEVRLPKSMPQSRGTCQVVP